MKTRAKLKRWFKEANRTISKFFPTSQPKKRKKHDARKSPKSNASVNTIPSEVEVIYKKKRAHNTLKPSKGGIFRYSEKGKRSPASRTKRLQLPKEERGAHDLSQSSTSKQISSRFERVSVISSGGSQLRQREKIYESIRNDKEYYKKLLSTLQLTALIRARKRDADEKFDLHKHTLKNHKLKDNEDKCGRSIRTYVIKESLSETSLTKTESSKACCTRAKQKTIQILQNQKAITPLEKNDNSKVLANKMSYSSLKAKISQIRQLLVDRKSSPSAKEKCSWGGQIIIPTCVVQSTKETDTKSIVKISPVAQDEEIELHVHTLTTSVETPNEIEGNKNLAPKTQDRLTCSQSPLVRQKESPKETVNCRNFVSAHLEAPNELKENRDRASTKTPKTQDRLTCGQSPLVKQKGIPKGTVNCRNFVPTPKSSKEVAQDTTKHAQEGLSDGQNASIKQNRISDGPLAMTKSTTKTQDTSKEAREDLKFGQSPLFKQNKIASETRSCRNYGSEGPLPLTTTKMQDATKQALESQSPLRKQSRISNEITEYGNAPDGYVKTIKNVVKIQAALKQEGFKSNQSLRRNRSSNYCAMSTKPVQKPYGEGSQLKKTNDSQEKPSIITIKDPRSLTMTSDYSVYKTELDSYKCDAAKPPQTTYPVRVRPKCPNENATQASQTKPRSKKKKSSGCCRSYCKKSSPHSRSSASTSSRNTSSASSPSAKGSSTSTVPSDQVVKTHTCDSSCITPHATPSPPVRFAPSPPSSPKRSKKSSSYVSCCGKPKRKKSKSPPPPVRQPKKLSSVSFGDNSFLKMSSPYPQNTCKAQKQSVARKSSSYCSPRRARSKPSVSRRSSKSKGPRCCASCKRKPAVRMSEKRVTNYNANKDLQRPPVVQPVLGMCNLHTCGTLIRDIKYAVVRITYFENYTTYEMMRSTSDKPRNIPNYVEKIFVTKETKFVIT